MARSTRRRGSGPRGRRTPRDPGIRDLGFSCFRMVPAGDQYVPMELWASSALMFAFVRSS